MGVGACEARTYSMYVQSIQVQVRISIDRPWIQQVPTYLRWTSVKKRAKSCSCYEYYTQVEHLTFVDIVLGPWPRTGLWTLKGSLEHSRSRLLPRSVVAASDMQ
jgi:hypothetical protein